MSKYRSAERVQKHRALKRKRDASPEENSILESEDTRMYIFNAYLLILQLNICN